MTPPKRPSGEIRARARHARDREAAHLLHPARRAGSRGNVVAPALRQAQAAARAVGHALARRAGQHRAPGPSAVSGATANAAVVGGVRAIQRAEGDERLPAAEHASPRPGAPCAPPLPRHSLVSAQPTTAIAPRRSPPPRTRRSAPRRRSRGYALATRRPTDRDGHGDHERRGRRRSAPLPRPATSTARRTGSSRRRRVRLVAVPSSASPLPRSSSGMCALPIAIRTPSVHA